MRNTITALRGCGLGGSVAETVKLRVLTVSDIEAVADLDESLVGVRRREYWQNRLERAEASWVPSLVAEINGRVIGFILGSPSGWEYGIPEDVALIDTIGVCHEYRGRGIGKQLFKEMSSMFGRVGIRTIYVFARQENGDLLRFCRSIGFREGDMIKLELTI